MSPGVVPGSGRMSTSTVASPGMTLYFIPAWMTSGLNVSRMTARRIRAWIGSHSAPIASSARRGSSPVAASRSRRWSSPSAALTSSSSRRTTGVIRGSPGVARRRTTSAARTAALSSRGSDPWPCVPVTWIR